MTNYISPKYILLKNVHIVLCLAFLPLMQANATTIDELKQRTFLDDYETNILLGYKIVTNTPEFAGRYVGNNLSCSSCHLNAGTKEDALPLNIAGMYPQWRAKNGRRNGISLRIRECFMYSHNGIMPSNDSPEVLAISSYIYFISKGQTIGNAPKGRGVPTLQRTGFDPNPARGKMLYVQKCQVCHGKSGQGVGIYPSLWGPDSYNSGAGINKISTMAGFVWANMPLGQEKSLTTQEAFDVAAYINMQIRPADPRRSKLLLLIDRITLFFLRGR